MKIGDKVGIVCCSNARELSEKTRINRLKQKLLNFGLEPVFGNFIYSENSDKFIDAKLKADTLMDMFYDNEIKMIFDISGGDIANEIIPLLDFKAIADSKKMFCGYSDLTAIINAIYAKSNKKSLLYQIKNIVGENESLQSKYFFNTMFQNKQDLFSFDYRFINGTNINGIVVGGNIRCFLKLAGTPYFPNMSNKVLFLEAFSGKAPLLVSYINQLKQMNVFEEINGIILGTFTQFENSNSNLKVSDLFLKYTQGKIPIVKTDEIGHAPNSKAIIIGEKINFQRECL